MSKETYVGGDIIEFIGGKDLSFAKEEILNIGSQVIQNGKETGVSYGINIKAPERETKFILKGEWRDSKNNIITKAKVGDTVYFHVEMTEKFPDTSLPVDKQKTISFKLYQFDGNEYSVGYIYFFAPIVTLNKEPKKGKEISYVTWEDINKNGELDPKEEYSKKPYTEVEAVGNKAVIPFQLSKGLVNYFDEIAQLKLLMTVSYSTDINIYLPKDEDAYLDIEPNPVIKEIYVRLLNYQPPKNFVNKLSEVGGWVQDIHGNDDKMSEKVNMDYFSVRIDELPKFANGNIMLLYKKIRENFLTLSKGSIPFESHVEPFHKNITGSWEFKPYPKKDEPTYATKQLQAWKNERGGTIIFIEAGGGTVEDLIGDSGAVLESESESSEMCWIFTTIFTEKSDTQPFSGHRQFGIHKDKEGNYRFFARAIDRIWPSRTILNLSLRNKNLAVKDYLMIADSTWRNLISHVSKFIVKNGGATTIMQPEMDRITFKSFNDKYYKTPVSHIGNIPQYKEISEDEI